jgi:hypothetical protein
VTPREEETSLSAALETRVRRLRRGESLADCLADCPPAYREEVARLAPLAARLGHLGLDPAPEFQARLEADLLAAVERERARRAAVPARRAWGGRPWWRAAAVALVVVLVLLGGGAGALAAAEGSLPDSPLYQVKEWREGAELALARDDAARLGVHGRIIQARGRELEWAVRAGKGRVMVALLALRLANATDRMVDGALAARTRGRPEAVPRALSIVTTMQARVDLLLAQAPPEVEPPLSRLRPFLAQQERRLRAP